MMSRTLLILVALSGVLSACVGPAPVPQDNFYRLPPPDGEQAGRTEAVQRLSVRAFDAAGLYRDRTILYVDASSPLQIHSYYYHQWMYPPAVLLQDQLIELLRASGIAPEVHRFRPGDASAGVIEGRIVNFERIVAAAGSEVLVRLELRLRRPGEIGERWSKEYSAQTRVAGDQMTDVVAAFGAAIDEISQQFISDLSTM